MGPVTKQDKIIVRLGEKPLDVVPGRTSVKKATKFFSMFYDEWMGETHRPLQEALLGSLTVATGAPGKKIIEVGVGTGYLLARYPYSIREKILNIDERASDGPIRLVGIDESPEMLLIAISRMKRRMNGLVEGVKMWENIYKTSFLRDYLNYDLDSALFRIANNINVIQDIGPHNQLKLSYKGIDILVAEFIKTDILSLNELKEQYALSDFDVVIASYIMHWVRGMENKRLAAETMFNITKEGGYLYSIEEWMLVVSKYLGTNELKAEFANQLFELVREATTPINMTRLPELIVSTGYNLVLGSNVTNRIDAEHNIYGVAYTKPTKKSIEAREALELYT